MRAVLAFAAMTIMSLLAACNSPAAAVPRDVAESINVPTAYDFREIAWLTAGDRVAGQLTSAGGEGVEAGIEFSVEGPSGMVLNSDKVRDTRSFNFTATHTGTYAFHFHNLSSTVPKRVDYAYTVKR